MAQEFDELFADLDAAKADLARKVKHCRTFFGERPLPQVTKPDAAESAFDWRDRQS